MKKDFIAAAMAATALSTSTMHDKCCVLRNPADIEQQELCIGPSDKITVEQLQMSESGNIECGAHVFATICPAGVTKVFQDRGKPQYVCAGHTEDE